MKGERSLPTCVELNMHDGNDFKNLKESHGRLNATQIFVQLTRKNCIAMLIVLLRSLSCLLMEGISIELKSLRVKNIWKKLFQPLLEISEDEKKICVK